jgi:hypothetical protein
MASSSKNIDDTTLEELAHLKLLHNKGILSLQEFLRMSTLITKSPSAHSDEALEDSSSDNGKNSKASSLVDESGNLFEECASPVPSLRSSKESPAQSAPRTPQSEPVAYTPDVWKRGEKVMHNSYGLATFIRHGDSSDFANNGRARIEYQKVEKGCKSKLETLSAWVTIASLLLVEPSPGVDAESSPVRKSPRIEAQVPISLDNQQHGRAAASRAYYANCLPNSRLLCVPAGTDPPRGAASRTCCS